MTFKTIQGVLHPDGHIALPEEALPSHPVQVLVTLLEPSEADALAEVGDYGAQLADYEESLARGEVKWQ